MRHVIRNSGIIYYLGRCVARYRRSGRGARPAQTAVNLNYHSEDFLLDTMAWVTQTHNWAERTMGHYLLIGAGFSRNWGGPLSEEITGSLLGKLHDDEEIAGALRRGRSRTRSRASSSRSAPVPQTQG
jgi:hypothetical protein